MSVSKSHPISSRVYVYPSPRPCRSQITIALANFFDHQTGEQTFRYSDDSAGVTDFLRRIKQNPRFRCGVDSRQFPTVGQKSKRLTRQQQCGVVPKDRVTLGKRFAFTGTADQSRFPGLSQRPQKCGRRRVLFITARIRWSSLQRLAIEADRCLNVFSNLIRVVVGCGPRLDTMSAGLSHCPYPTVYHRHLTVEKIARTTNLRPTVRESLCPGHLPWLPAANKAIHRPQFADPRSGSKILDRQV